MRNNRYLIDPDDELINVEELEAAAAMMNDLENNCFYEKQEASGFIIHYI